MEEKPPQAVGLACAAVVYLAVATGTVQVSTRAPAAGVGQGSHHLFLHRGLEGGAETRAGIARSSVVWMTAPRPTPVLALGVVSLPLQ